MRLEHCIRRWLGLRAHRVRSIEETDEGLVAEIEAVEGRRPQCGHCGRKVRRTKGRTKRRLWRDLKIRKLALVLAYTPRRVVCPDCGVRIEKVPWAQRWSRVTKSLARAAAELARRTDLSTVATQFSINWKTVAGDPPCAMPSDPGPDRPPSPWATTSYGARPKPPRNWATRVQPPGRCPPSPAGGISVQA
jgi:hypothetical protein